MFKILMCILGLFAFQMIGCEGSSADGSRETTGVTTAQDVAEEVQGAAEAVESFTEDKLHEYRAVMADRLEQVDRHIASLEARADELSDDARSELESVLENVRARRTALQAELDELKVTSRNAWQDVKGGLDRSWSELDEAIEDAVARFGRDTQGGDEQVGSP